MKVCIKCQKIVDDKTEKCDCGCTVFQILLFREGEYGG